MISEAKLPRARTYMRTVQTAFRANLSGSKSAGNPRKGFANAAPSDMCFVQNAMKSIYRQAEDIVYIPSIFDAGDALYSSLIRRF